MRAREGNATRRFPATAYFTAKPNEGDMTMKTSTLISLGISASIAVFATGVAISAQDKYTLQVPNGSPSPSSGERGLGGNCD
jgi:hypothetical protein